MNEWQNFLKNLGEWQGSFTQLTPEGQEIRSTPSLLTLEGFEENQRVQFRLRRYADFSYPDPPIQDYSQDYRSLGRQIVFFNDGTFSKGPWQLAPFTEFGAEFGHIAGDRRMRLVQLYNKDLTLGSLTLIREFRKGTAAKERPPLTIQQLLGTWQGEAYTVTPQWSEAIVTPTELTIVQEGNRLQQRLSIGEQTLSSTGTIEGNTLHFTETAPRKVLLLPDGASCLTLDRLELRQPFFLEVGWLVEDHLRHRLIRRYDASGAWESSTLVIEKQQHLN